MAIQLWFWALALGLPQNVPSELGIGQSLWIFAGIEI
jgi:hypothetical protein